jgi:hypothetical protein
MKDCKSCRHYGFVKTEDKLNSNKSVTRGRIQYEFCNKGTFYLTGYKPCQFHEVGNRSARIMPPPVPKKGREYDQSHNHWSITLCRCLSI